MYLDKPMRDHVLLQAIARVNRPYEDENSRKKPSGFVLDFVGIFDNLEKALAFDSSDVEGVISDISVLKERFSELIAEGKKDYLTIIKDKKQDKAVEGVLEHFRSKKERETYYEFYRDLSNIYDILSPDAFLRPFIEDYQTRKAISELEKHFGEGKRLGIKEPTPEEFEKIREEVGRRSLARAGLL